MDGSLPPHPFDQRPVREPMFNAPWPVTVVVVAIVGAYALQVLWGADAAVDRFGLHPALLWRGDFGALIAMLFLHGGWPHAIMNALAALAFGAPVARFLGTGPRGGAAFFAFYVLCGVLSGVGYAAMH